MMVPSRRVGKDLRVNTTFSTHCFSESYGKIPHPQGDPIIDYDTRRPRTFCPIRYGHSKLLPDLVRSLPDVDVWQTSAVRNWVYSVSIDDPSGPYHMFFEIKKAPAEQRTWQDLNLIVESAYPSGPPAVRGKKPFVIVCAEAYLGARKQPKKR